jgi:thiol-disulfide isomerase/thioredoxin
LIAEYNDFFPIYAFPPELTDDEVERFVQLGELGWELNRTGNRTAAEAAFRSQIEIYSFNPEPYASLALLAAAHGEKKPALDHLRAAVMRGYTDMYRFERSEVWEPLKRNRNFLRLVDAVPDLLERERTWPLWESFYTVDTPTDLKTLLERHADARAEIERMSPAIGERYGRLWNRLFDRVAATLLEAYVTNKPDAPDYIAALERLMTFYGSASVLRWDRLPDDPARRLAAAAEAGLERFKAGPQRASALYALALGKNNKRDGDGRLTEGAAGLIRAVLNEVLTDYPDSKVAISAAIGLIRTEMETGRREQAAMIYSALKRADQLDSVRADLGGDALLLGGLPEFEARTLDGRTFDKPALQAGRITVLDFWATWCAPCLEELPNLQWIDANLGDEVALVGINMDSAEELGAEELRQWIEDRGVPGEHLFDGDGWQSDLVRAFGVKEIPFNVVVGPDGEVLAINQHGKQLRKSVETAVRRAHPRLAGKAD